MKTRIVGSALVALGLGFALIPATANASVSQNLKFEFLEVGSDVVATVTGSLDRGAGSGLTSQGGGVFQGIVSRNGSDWFLAVGPTSSVNGTAYSGLTLNSGSGQPAIPDLIGSFVSGDSGSGLIFSVSGLSIGLGVGVDDSYTDGAAINSTTTWLNKSFSTLGLNTGTWVYGYGSAGNTVTMQVGPSSGAVPEPGEWAAMGVLGAGLTGLVLRKRRKA